MYMTAELALQLWQDRTLPVVPIPLTHTCTQHTPPQRQSLFLWQTRSKKTQLEDASPGAQKPRMTTETDVHDISE